MHGWSESLRERAALFDAWLQGRADDVIIADLADLPDAQWFAFVDAFPHLVTEGVARRLIETAHLAAGGYAISLGRLATRVAEHTVATAAPSAFAEISGDAWKEYAAALKAAADLPKARAACVQARLFYGLAGETRDLRHKHALVLLLEGRIIYALGEIERGIELMGQSALELFALGDKRKHVQARTLFAGALLSSDRVDEALTVFEDIVAVAREMGDTETLAHILNDVGMCYGRLGKVDKARECFNTALEMFKMLAKHAEVPRVRGNLAYILRDEGKYHEAIWELQQCRRAFLDLELPIVAALVAIDIVEIKLLAGRTSDVPSLCAEMVRTFTDSNLPQEAKRAFAYLHEAAAQKRDVSVELSGVRSFMMRLQVSPNVRFAAGEPD